MMPIRALTPTRVWDLYKPDLKLFFTFEEGAGTETYDKSGNGYVGTLVGGATFGAGTGRYGDSLTLDGVNGKATVGTGLFDLPAISVCAWINTTQATGVDRRIVATGSENTNEWTLTVEEAGYGLMTNRAASHACPRTDAIVRDGVWHHLVGISDPESIYMDGVLQSSTHTDSHSLEADFKIGSRGTTYYFGGLIDDVMIFNRALSAEEIRQLYTLQYGYRVLNPVRMLAP